MSLVNPHQIPFAVEDTLNNQVNAITYFGIQILSPNLQYLHSSLVERLMVSGMEIMHGLNMRFLSTKLIWLLPLLNNSLALTLNSTHLEFSILYNTQWENTATWW